jgi:alpha-amylase
MTAIVFYFQVHQPFRLRRYSFFDIGHSHEYFDDAENARILRRVSEKCYVPMTSLLRRLVGEWGDRFRCAFSISGTALDQLERWAPEALDGFRSLAASGNVEFLAETSHHSLACLYDEEEFESQVRAHARRIQQLFGVLPTTFRNTELVCSNRIARLAEGLGMRGILGEGADHLLGWRSPHYVYRPESCERIKLLLRSYRLADDIAFRFSNRGWSAWPLSAEKFAHWLHTAADGGDLVGLFMDFETFGEHQWADTGIFDFFANLPQALLAHPGFRFATPGEVIAACDPVARMDLPHPVSWADAERDLTAWLGNPMQRAASEALYALARTARRAASAGRTDLLEAWRRLTTSDHVYYMCTKWFSDGDVHKYFSPFASPHDAFITFMNALDDCARCLAPWAESEVAGSARERDAARAKVVELAVA